MEFKDYYQILGVEPDAEAAQIKAAYRKLARKYHPDMNPDKGAEEKFKEVAEAYEVLKDPARRAEYDELHRYGSHAGEDFRPPPGWKPGAQAGFESARYFEGDFSDFFNSIFGGGFGAEAGGRTGAARGRDVELEMPVFLEETLAEHSRSVEYEVPVLEKGGLRHVRKHLKVKVPRGVTDGERIRLKGQGAPGIGEGPAGDLYLHVRLVPHPLFDVRGHNLVLTLPLAPWEAALGARVTVPTLDGRISLTIPPNTQAGGTLRIKGKGLPADKVTGDLLAVVKIVMPPQSGARAEQLWRELAEAAPFDARKEWGQTG